MSMNMIQSILTAINSFNFIFTLQFYILIFKEKSKRR